MDVTLRQLLDTLHATEHTLLVLNERVEELTQGIVVLGNERDQYAAQAASLKETLKARQEEARVVLLEARADRKGKNNREMATEEPVDGAA